MSQASTLFSCLEELCKDWSIAIDVAYGKDGSISSEEDLSAAIRGILQTLQGQGKHPAFIKGRQDIAEVYTGPLLAQIDKNSWVYIPFFEKTREETLELFDPEADGLVKVKSVQFLQRWNGSGILFPTTSYPEPQRGTPQLAPLDAGAPAVSTGLQCLCLVGRHHGLDVDERRLTHEHALDREELSLPHLLDIALSSGLHGRITRLTWKKALSLQQAFPVLVEKRDGSYALLCNIQQAEDESLGLLALSPGHAGKETDSSPLQIWDQKTFEELCTGKTLLLKRRYSIADEEQPFGLLWFIPEFLRHKKLFAQIALSVILITCISLLTPLFFQIVIDKVLPHRTYTTLNILAGGMIIVIVYNCFLEFLKSYLLLYATNKIDINLSIRTFHHLMRLPLSFFESIPAGLILKHMQQSEKIRGFLSGNLFFALLDVCSLIIFIPFLLLYSVHLTALVFLFSVLMALVVVSLIKPFQRRLNTLYKAEGKRQSRLVESIRGIQTVKALAVEPLGEKEWNDISAYAIQSYFNVGKISLAAKLLSQFLEMTMNIAIVWYGAHLVFDMSISIGALVAFQMVSGRVSAPLVKLVSLVHEYQQVALSVKMLGAIMNSKPEHSGGNLHTDIKGDIDFQHITFQYKPDLQPVINNFSLKIAAGEVVGVVGRSGSGKSTLSKLLQAMYTPQQGVIKIDHTDIRELDKMHLRSNIGMVLQENYFFQGTIRDNIRLAKPGALPEEVIHVARLAGAHDFITNFRTGYDTMLEENAVNLSGGQKQRLAIARALLADPRILILDEATSALDPESEWEIQKNLHFIAQGKTVIIISHRLSLMRHTDKIIVLDKGNIIAQGTHEDLLKCPGLYKEFWNQQMIV